jgi:hypothetical protein
LIKVVVVGFEFQGFLFPETFIVDETPFEVFGVDFLDIFVEGAESADVAFKDGADVFD